MAKQDRIENRPTPRVKGVGKGIGHTNPDGKYKPPRDSGGDTVSDRPRRDPPGEIIRRRPPGGSDRD